MHKTQKPVRLIVGYVADLSAGITTNALIATILPVASLNPLGKIAVPLGRYFIGAAVGMRARKAAHHIVDDAYEMLEELDIVS